MKSSKSSEDCQTLQTFIYVYLIMWKSQKVLIWVARASLAFFSFCVRLSFILFNSLFSLSFRSFRLDQYVLLDTTSCMVHPQRVIMSKRLQFIFEKAYGNAKIVFNKSLVQAWHLESMLLISRLIPPGLIWLTHNNRWTKVGDRLCFPLCRIL